MGIIIGPFDPDDWYSMGQIKKDLAFTRKMLDKVVDDSKRRDYKTSERHIRDQFRKYIHREVA